MSTIKHFLSLHSGNNHQQGPFFDIPTITVLQYSKMKDQSIVVFLEENLLKCTFQ